jgi:hypothetical protein
MASPAPSLAHYQLLLDRDGVLFASVLDCPSFENAEKYALELMAPLAQAHAGSLRAIIKRISHTGVPTRVWVGQLAAGALAWQEVTPTRDL